MSQVKFIILFSFSLISLTCISFFQKDFTIQSIQLSSESDSSTVLTRLQESWFQKFSDESRPLHSRAQRLEYFEAQRLKFQDDLNAYADQLESAGQDLLSDTNYLAMVTIDSRLRMVIFDNSHHCSNQADYVNFAYPTEEGQQNLNSSLIERVYKVICSAK